MSMAEATSVFCNLFLERCLGIRVKGVRGAEKKSYMAMKAIDRHLAFDMDETSDPFSN